MENEVKDLPTESSAPLASVGPPPPLLSSRSSPLGSPLPEPSKEVTAAAAGAGLL